MLIQNGSSGGKTRRFSGIRKSVVAAVTGVALALGSVTAAPMAEAQPAVQPDYPDDSRAWDPKLPFGPGQDIANNPSLTPGICGGKNGNLKIALVFDVSSSIGEDGLRDTKSAGDAVVTALNDAPVQIGIYNFGTKAPSSYSEGAQTLGGPLAAGSEEVLKEKIAQLAIPARPRIQGTNWDRGISQIPTGTYDVVYFITDGLPTAYGDAVGSVDTQRGANNRPAFNHANGGAANKDYAAAKLDVQEAVKSANALKASGTRIVPLAVGKDVKGDLASTYLEYISGPGDAIPVGDYGQLTKQLVAQATEGCAGEVTIQKQLTDANGETTADSLAGFKFEASGISDKFRFTNTETITGNDGKATFGYVAPDNAASGFFTIKEVGAEFKNVSCTSADGEPWERNGNSFIVPAKAGGEAECTVTNPAPVTVTVTETTTETPSTVTETTTVEPITTTVTEIPEAVTTVEITTVTEIPEPSTVEKTVTETPDPVTVTEVPDPLTETLTETPDPETETVTVTTTETQEPTPTTVTQTTTQTETSTATQTETATETATATATATQTETATATQTETATATETATETETQTDTTTATATETETTTATTTATDMQVLTSTETTTVTEEPVTVVETVTPAPVTETVTAEVTVVNEIPGKPVTVTNTSTVTETVDNTVEKTVEQTVNNTVTETVDNTIEKTVEKTVDNVVTSVVEGEPVTVTNNATVTETQTETTTVVPGREPATATATVTVTETETQVVTTTVSADDAGAGNAGAKETVTVTTTAALFPGSSNDGGILGGSSFGSEGGSSAKGIVDDRCIPAAIGLTIPLLALIPLHLLQQVSIPGLDAYSAEINSRITQANNQIQQQLGIFDENTARAVQEFNAQVHRIGAENQQILQWAGIAAAVVGVASYLFYFCVPRPDAEQGSSN